MTVTPATLATYLGATVETAQAQLVIDNATNLCLLYVDPLPAAADAVILNICARAYSNPTGVGAQTVGPYTAQYNPTVGLTLSRADRRTLFRASGSGGAFTFDPTPADAGPYTIIPQYDLAPGEPSPFFSEPLVDGSQQ